MSRKSLVTAVSVIVAALGACSSEEPKPEDQPIRSIEQHITTACNENTVGLPCDPDGAGGIAECEAVCHLGTDGSAACVPIVELGLANLNGRICGTTMGVGDEACTRYCSGKSCLAVNAPAGAACRPVAGDTTCQGACDGAGACVPLDDPCPFGREVQSCQFAACTFTNATQCVTLDLLAATPCSNLDVCEIGNCNDSGQCIGSGEVGCDDGNPCTDDVCDANSGACIGIPNTKSCDDKNRCTVMDRCVSGTCQGSAPRDCDDGNACTADSCNPDTGCVREKKTCSDSDPCTVDNRCDPVSGECYFPPRDCSDNDPCTADSCESNGRCRHTPLDCDDDDACTADSCAEGQCEHGPIDCDDGDPCTTDSCDSASGCSNVEVEGCVGSDAGTGGSASDGSGASGGAASSGGATGTGGAPATGGSGGSDTTASGGTGAGAMGGTSSGGTGGAAGDSNDGSGGSSTDASGTGGNSAGGTSGESSTATGGTSGLGGTNSSSTGGGSGGSDVTASAAGGSGGSVEGPTGGGKPKDDGDGCGCRVVGGSRDGQPSWLLLLGVALAVFRRRH